MKFRLSFPPRTKILEPLLPTIDIEPCGPQLSLAMLIDGSSFHKQTRVAIGRSPDTRVSRTRVITRLQRARSYEFSVTASECTLIMIEPMDYD